MIRNTYMLAGVLFLGASSVVANTKYDCERTFLSSVGFASYAAAGRWFPEKGWIVYSADGKRSATGYGISENRAKVHRKHGISKVIKPGGRAFDFRHEDFDRDKSVLRVSVQEPGFKQTTPSLYSCGPGKKTSWWPEED